MSIRAPRYAGDALVQVSHYAYHFCGTPVQRASSKSACFLSDASSEPIQRLSTLKSVPMADDLPRMYNDNFMPLIDHGHAMVDASQRQQLQGEAG